MVSEVEYLASTGFGTESGDAGDFTIQIGSYGVTVDNHCCSGDMSASVARSVHEALGRYLADLDRGGAATQED